MSAGGGLETREERERRVRLLEDPAFAPLEAWRREVEAQWGPTPHFDPLDGGIAAAVLLLLETPGPWREAPRPGPRGQELRFVSADNPTGTARNIRRFLHAAGIGRERVVIANAVPWTIHAPGARNRAPRRGEIAAGAALLPGLLALLPRLRVVVMAGRVAQGAAAILGASRPELRLVAMPHPSPTFVATSPAVAARIGAALAEARGVLEG